MLTERERQVLDGVVHGRTSKEKIKKNGETEPVPPFTYFFMPNFRSRIRAYIARAAEA
jgi:hypothetical protein